MAIPTFLMCILPTYAQVGMIATILMIIVRLLQGFAAGGELPSEDDDTAERRDDPRNKTTSFVGDRN